jgi:glyoxylase I family protein
MFKKIDHIEIIPKDLAATIKFYVDVLGFTLKQRQKVDQPPLQEVVYLELADTKVELMSVENPAASPQNEWTAGYRMLALEVEDMDQAVNYLTEKNIEITWGPIDLGGTIRAEITDPNGLPIELREW